MDTMALPVVLTGIEVEERAADLANLLDDRAQLADDAKAAAGSYRERLKFIDAKVERLGRVVRERKETRQVEVETRKDKVRRVALTVRLDTDEIVARRSMTETELQGQLFDNGPDSAEDFPDESFPEKPDKPEKKKRAKAARRIEA